MPLAAPSIYHAVRARTYEAFGVAINPHLFRDSTVHGTSDCGYKQKSGTRWRDDCL